MITIIIRKLDKVKKIEIYRMVIDVKYFKIIYYFLTSNIGTDLNYWKRISDRHLASYIVDVPSKHSFVHAWVVGVTYIWFVF